jgi:hypothetical protein
VEGQFPADERNASNGRIVAGLFVVAIFFVVISIICKEKNKKKLFFSKNKMNMLYF